MKDAGLSGVNKKHASLLEDLLSAETISLLFTSFSVRVFTSPAELSRVLKPLSRRARRCRLGCLRMIIKHVTFPNEIKSDAALNVLKVFRGRLYDTCGRDWRTPSSPAESEDENITTTAF